jgi:hypothetical protein
MVLLHYYFGFGLSSLRSAITRFRQPSAGEADHTSQTALACAAERASVYALVHSCPGNIAFGLSSLRCGIVVAALLGSQPTVMLLSSHNTSGFAACGGS